MKTNKILVFLGSIFVLLALAYVYHINSVTREGWLKSSKPTRSGSGGRDHSFSRAELQAAEDSVAGSSFNAEREFVDGAGEYLDADNIPDDQVYVSGDGHDRGGIKIDSQGQVVDSEGYTVIKGADQQTGQNINDLFEGGGKEVGGTGLDIDGLPAVGDVAGLPAVGDVAEDYDQGRDFNFAE